MNASVALPGALGHTGAETTTHGVQMVEWGGEPAYRQVSNDLRERIAAGEFNEPGRLPSLSTIEKEYDVSITVARGAVRQLREDGLVKSHQGKAAYLVPGAAEIAAGAAGPAPASSEVAELRRDLASLREELSDVRQRLSRLERGTAKS